MRYRPTLTTARYAEIAREIFECRQAFVPDSAFFKASEFWEYLCEDDNNWSIRRVRSENGDRTKRASVIELFGKVKLVVSEKLMNDADKGCRFANFVLAHELGHVALDHYAQRAGVRNFQLRETQVGYANDPSDVQELEANVAAVFLLCGPQILDGDSDLFELARKASCEIKWVKKIASLVRLDVFREAFERKPRSLGRVIL